MKKSYKVRIGSFSAVKKSYEVVARKELKLVVAQSGSKDHEKDVHSLYHFREDPFCQWYAVVFGHW